MAINKSKLIKSIIMQCGLVELQLPFNKPPEEIVSEVLDNVTLPEFSQWEKLRLKFGLSLSNLKYAPSRMTNMTTTYAYGQNIQYAPNNQLKLSTQIYYLPDEILKLNLMDIELVEQDLDRFSDDDIAYTWYLGSLSELAPSLIDAIAYSNLVGSMGFKENWEFIEPNKIKLSGYYDNILIYGQFQHTSFSTIPSTCWSSLSELALLDVKNYCYQILKNYDNIQTSRGQINIRIEEWSSANQERTTLIQSWDDLSINGNVLGIEFL